MTISALLTVLSYIDKEKWGDYYGTPNEISFGQALAIIGFILTMSAVLYGVNWERYFRHTS